MISHRPRVFLSEYLPEVVLFKYRDVAEVCYLNNPGDPYRFRDSSRVRLSSDYNPFDPFRRFIGEAREAEERFKGYELMELWNLL